ncbi:hypothetical protein RUMOBE_03271 [Blautia obeum ATCC 29174]|uniref:Uncharacterized protein n=1 Tax=Blautia obeum ATCC 29174 TaxID=411459 RepID=A5ZW78_9FIRM|nr:hypothetical protein RUMOBE_03271 [Blautia obeum ATCC 29174]
MGVSKNYMIAFLVIRYKEEERNEESYFSYKSRNDSDLQ